MLERKHLELLPYSPSTAEITPDEIVLPEIYIDDALRAVFSGNEYDVSFDPNILAKGAEAAGITNHVSVVLFSADQLNLKDEPHGIHYEENNRLSRDTVFMAVDESPIDTESAQTAANVRLWTAVLTSNILDEPNSAQQELELLRKQIRKSSLRRKIGGGALTSAGVTGKAAMMTGKVGLPLLLVAGVQAAGFGFGFMGRRKGKKLETLHLFSDRFEQHIIRKMAPLAEALAEEFPVIDYTVEQPEQ